MAHTSAGIMLRVQGREGTKRFTFNPDTSVNKLYEEIGSTFGHDPSAFQLYVDKIKKRLIPGTGKVRLSSFGLRHGDLIYMHTAAPKNDESSATGGDAMEVDTFLASAGPSRSSSSASLHKTASALKLPPPPEDAVDIYLKTLNGQITRARDPKMCRHNENGKCIFCAPLEPYDETYLAAQGIKHLSFHSYLKKLTGGIDKGKFAALEDLNVSIKEGCKDHPPWPRGICSKCQPSAVTLNRQLYRHVDNVMFENPQIVERFLSYWRTSGHQRIGMLYGKYEEHADVPLGIRARVVTIYEPPQESGRDKVKLTLPDPNEQLVDELAKSLGIQCVGWVFTDLLPDDTTKGTVKHLRGIHSYFLSAQECITAAYLQNKYPNPCTQAQTGNYFGSKFTTVLITGDDKNQVHMVSYQVSNQCMALVKGSCLVPTRDAPELGYVIESSEKKYVPDVFFKEKDEYGNEVTRLGRPLPVEYLLVNLTVSTPKEPVSMFALKDNIEYFPSENRQLQGQIQDFSKLAEYLSQFDQNEPFLRVASDFHLLYYLAIMDVVQLRDTMGPLLDAVRDRNADSADIWSKSEAWLTVEQLIAASSFTPVTPFASGSGTGGGRPRPQISPQSTWTCNHCTFINGGTNPNCEVCNLPRN